MGRLGRKELLTRTLTLFPVIFKYVIYIIIMCTFNFPYRADLA